MGFSPVAASEHIYDKYRRYLKTIFAIDDPEYNLQFQKLLEDRRGLVAGPYLDVSDSFVKGKSLEELIGEGVLAEEFRKIHMPLTRPLYLHQEKAFRKVLDGENLIVSTGTGSGKTECFLIPVLNELLREQEAGTLNQGVRALLIYPMNALANDQIERLRDLLADCPEITFGSYTGQTKESFDDALADYKELNNGNVPLPNELISRQQIKDNLPHILVTNYAMLEYLMVRPKDNVFFDEIHADKWKFIILDEAHVYNGSSGIEVGMLLRRLKAMLQNDRIQYILTSATLGSEDSDAEVAAFGSNLCSSPFSKENIIRAVRYQPVPDRELKALPASFYKKIADAVNRGVDDDSLGEFADIHGDDGKDIHETLYDLILHDENYIKLRRVLKEPLSVPDILERMNWTEEELVDFVTAAGKAVRNGDRLFDARYHTFLRATDSVFVTLKPEKKLFLTRQKTHIEHGERRCVFEIGTCSVCHAMYIIGRKNENDCIVQTSVQSEAGPREAYLIRDAISDNDEDHLLENEQMQAKDYEICSICGHIHRPGKTGCGHGAEYMTKVFRVWTEEEKGSLTKCPACENTNPFGILRQFFTGQEAVTSVLGTALFEELPSYSVTIRKEKQEDDGFDLEDEPGMTEETHPEAKQFIAFSDNRQAAAFFASYFDQSYRIILYKRLIVEALNNYRYGQERISIPNFVHTLAGLFEKFHLLNLEETQSEREAWKAVLQEMTDNNSGTSLLKTGLAAFTVPPDAAADNSKYHLTQEDIAAMINVLILGMMSDAAISYEYPLNTLDKEFFTYGGVECSYTFSDSDAKKYRRAFSPKDPKRTNKREDYIRRVFEKTGCPADKETTGKFMKGLWDKLLVGRGVVTAHDGVYKLDSARLQIFRPQRWYLCPKCRRLTPFSVHGVCPTYQCPGELREINIGEYNGDNHYYALYNTLDIRSLRVVEHTAQLSKEIAYDYQKKFKQKEIDVLSCSTTFEMGVDVGTLETVFMRNMPPSPANYAQRAGRAGRSRLASAFALTFCNKRSHDFSYFNRPVQMIRGRIDPPKFEMENDKIAVRHVFASALAFFWRRNPAYFSTAANMVEEKEGVTDGFESFRKYLDEKPEDLKQFILRFLPESLSEKFRVKDFGWVDLLLNESEEDAGVLTRAFKEYNYEVKVLSEAYQKAISEQKHADRFLNQIRVYQREEILSFLSRKNVMPKYGFPVDTVELHLSGKQEKAKAGLQLSRDLSVAISEYAPGSQVVANGELITSRYIRKVPGMSWKQYMYNTCKCGTLNIEPYSEQEDTEGRMKECRQCGESLNTAKSEIFLVPAFGFEADSRIEKPGLKKPERTFSGEISYVGYQNKIEPKRLELNGSVFEVVMSHNDEMAVLNKSNFFVCSYCGYTELVKDLFVKVKKAKHNRPTGSKCSSDTLARRSIGYRFETDVFQLRFLYPEVRDMDVALSLLYGIMRGICSQLNIEQDDISGCVQFFRNEETGSGGYALIFYDRTPGGAGHVKRLYERGVLEGALKETLNLMKQCTCGGADMDTSCYGCLRTYYNQKHHDQLRRSYVVRFIEELFGNKPVKKTSDGERETAEPEIVIRPAEEKHQEEAPAGDLDLTVVQDGMNLNEQLWEDIWEYMLDEDPEPEEEVFWQYLLDHADDLGESEKPYKGNCQLKDRRKVKTDLICCNMLWKQKKILLFTAENGDDYRKASASDWTCVFTMEGESAAKKLIEKLKE